MKKLTLHNYYSREDIHSVFAPETRFSKGSGTWGNHGIIPIPKRDNDFVFIVTYGQSQGGHDFDEGISSDGVLSWQSQPRHDLKHNDIKTFINHNEEINNIYLFLRKEKKGDYEYLGRLKYLSHDKERQNPVYFQWQLLDFDGDNTKKIKNNKLSKEKIKLGNIELVNQMPDPKKIGITKNNFQAKKTPDYALRESNNAELGEIGEELVLKYEKKFLASLGKNKLLKKIVHTSKVEGDGAGYDIKSFNEDGSVKYIEVKTTRGSINTDFYMSPRELSFANLNKESFCLYRVFDLKKRTNNGKFFVFKGDLEKNFNMTPTGFRLSRK